MAGCINWYLNHHTLVIIFKLETMIDSGGLGRMPFGLLQRCKHCQPKPPVDHWPSVDDHCFEHLEINLSAMDAVLFCQYMIYDMIYVFVLMFLSHALDRQMFDTLHNPAISTTPAMSSDVSFSDKSNDLNVGNPMPYTITSFFGLWVFNTQPVAAGANRFCA